MSMDAISSSTVRQGTVIRVRSEAEIKERSRRAKELVNERLKKQSAKLRERILHMYHRMMDESPESFARQICRCIVEEEHPDDVVLLAFDSGTKKSFGYAPAYALEHR